MRDQIRPPEPDDNLISPDEPGYAFIRYFCFDFVDGRILANPVADATDQQRAQVTISIFNLNQPALCRLRCDGLKLWAKLPAESRMPDEHAFRDFLLTGET